MTRMTRMRDEMRALAVVGAVCACIGAAYGAYAAFGFWRVVTWDCHSTCHPGGLYKVQLALGLVGLLPAAFLLFATFSRRKRLALGALACGVAIYAAWALAIANATNRVA
jgi:hypothetical protein